MGMAEESSTLFSNTPFIPDLVHDDKERFISRSFNYSSVIDMSSGTTTIKRLGRAAWFIHNLLVDEDLDPSGGASPSKESAAFLVIDAKKLVLVVDHKRTGSNSTNLDILLYASHDGTVFDTVPYQSYNLGANEVISRPITPGPVYLKAKADNKDSVNSTRVSVFLLEYQG